MPDEPYDDRPDSAEEREAQESKAEERAREERIARRREGRAPRGMRRFRPGLARGVPWQLTPPSERAQEEALDHEIQIIANAVRDIGPITEDELRRVVGAKYWGPGRFRPAVRQAVAEREVVRLDRKRLGPPPDDAG
ncbi:uS7 family ribosomal protein [Nocardioides terrisoli]|uniref:hypothetical protein n=1 Tax=Nocardioides terrisoli TaxID=3388267 RepID=UPI00287B7368|nr:hypothetical protein [Nocardioides marmorisolisilvae]